MNHDHLSQLSQRLDRIESFLSSHYGFDDGRDASSVNSGSYRSIESLLDSPTNLSLSFDAEPEKLVKHECLACGILAVSIAQPDTSTLPFGMHT